MVIVETTNIDCIIIININEKSFRCAEGNAKDSKSNWINL